GAGAHPDVAVAAGNAAQRDRRALVPAGRLVDPECAAPVPRVAARRFKEDVMAQTRTPDKRSSLILPEGQHKYPLSWFDRFFCWVDSLPIAPWLFYVIIGIVLMAGELAINWFQGDEPVGTVHFF